MTEKGNPYIKRLLTLSPLSVLQPTSSFSSVMIHQNVQYFV